ncbi:hypothetical protein BHM03_00048281 [Ensete ventricosum]|nr:hypothetical protein BHM03_00048281 [Ensete ventricosum]
MGVVSSAVPVRTLLLTTTILFALVELSSGATRHYKFDVGYITLRNVTRVCKTKSIVTVNGEFPGPKIVAREGDRVVVKVVNHVENNITIHWYDELHRCMPLSSHRLWSRLSDTSLGGAGMA